MLQRSAAAKFAASVFFTDLNDFDVYVEDRSPGYPKIFSKILSRALASTVSLERVYPLGGRERVIDAARNSADLAMPGRKSVYIIDGDLYLLCGEKIQLPRNVICLPRYCIENFLFDESSLLTFMDQEDHEKSTDKLSELFDYKGWLTRSKDELRKLFVAFAVTHKLGLGEKTVSLGHSSICDGQSGEISAKKAQTICDELYKKANEQFGEEQVAQTKKEILENIDSNNCFVSTYVSAKDFTLPLMLVRARNITGTKATNLSIKLRLSSYCDITPFNDVIKQIGNIIERAEIVPS